jgi:hypothetical protein
MGAVETVGVVSLIAVVCPFVNPPRRENVWGFPLNVGVDGVVDVGLTVWGGVTMVVV